MKIIKLTLAIIIALSSILVAQENNDTVKSLDVITVRTLEIHKSKESRYDKFKNMFSDYDGTWFEDMFTYSADMLMPDEMMYAIKDVIKNRRDEGHNKQDEQVLKTFGNDTYNMFLTTMYYYMQDVSQISERVWRDEVCKPDTCTYQKERDPVKVLLDLKASEDNARGVTENDVVLPLNDNFPDAFYPYAQKPDGCTTEGLHDLYRQSNTLSDDDKWLTQACNEHDRCYSTIGTSAKECNSRFIVRAIDACNAISAEKTVLSMGSKNAFCGFKGLIISTGASACSKKYFDYAQCQQKLYMQWVETYEKAYRKAIAAQKQAP